MVGYKEEGIDTFHLEIGEKINYKASKHISIT